ncbi:MAG: polysaccharide deacetylase family protein [Gemmataceae bacterium]|nr:polysaccharide deacetylase family protein [Gemmataceae bacterium]
MVRSALLGLYKHSGLMALQSAVRRQRGRTRLSIVLFHRVTDAVPRDGLTVGIEWFRDFCALLRRSYRVITLAEAFRYANDSQPIPPNTVAITFDDTYADNLPAARILADHRLPATFFASTSYVGSERSYPWDAHLPKMPNLTWDEVREMASLGHEIGSHSAEHADFGKIDAETARRELTESKRILEEQLQRTVRWFAYPFGGREHFRPEYLPLVFESGYQGCVSAYGGFVRPGMKGQILPREAMPYFRNLTHLELHLSGCFDWIYACKRRFGWKR